MKKSLLSVVLLFIAWAVSASVASTPRSAIVRLEDAGSPNSRVHRSYAQVCPVGMQPKMCPTGHGFHSAGIGVLPHATRLVALPGHTSAQLRCTRLRNESVSCGHVGDSLEYSAFPGGYFTPAGVFYYITDWQGNNIAVFSDKGELVQQTTYYPYGEPSIEPSGQRYLYGGKEREHAGGRNSYDYGPRNLGPSANWDSADRKATENYPISPFSYCNGDPINHIDPTGMKSAVIRIDGEIGHIALLVQHADDGLYHYYSFNGDKMHASSTSSGHSINNHGEVGFTSVEEFMNSSFNQEGSEARVTNHEIAGFKYTEALELNTTAEQDASIISAFEQSSKFPYDLIKHNCAHVVSDAIIPNLQNDPYQNSYDKRMNIPEVRPSFKPEGESYITDLLLFLYDSILTPNSLFNEIKRHTENK